MVGAKLTSNVTNLKGAIPVITNTCRFIGVVGSVFNVVDVLVSSGTTNPNKT